MSPKSAHEDEPLSGLQARLKAHELGTPSVSPSEVESDTTPHSEIPKAAIPPQPLIDKVSNKWRDEKSGKDCVIAVGDRNDCGINIYESGDERNYLSKFRSFGRSRRGKKMLAYILAVLILGLYIWQRYLLPVYQEERVMREGFLRQENGTFGIAKGGEFLHGDVKILKLDEHLVPGGEADKKGNRRLVFVGDIHGCKEELVALLEAVGFDKKRDHLIATGDVISKGPDSPGVLDELIRLKATSVRGNHEDRILASASTVTQSDIEALGNKWASKDAKILKHLKPRHLRYLHSMPLILRIPALSQAEKPNSRRHSPLAEEILVVHAGLVPAIPLEKQDPYYVMNMRSLHPKSHVPSSEHANKHKKSGKRNKPWIEIWNYYNNILFRRRSIKGFRGFDVKAQRGDDSDGWMHKVWQSIDWSWSNYRSASRPKPQVVVYGHDSKTGLSITRWTKGLDSGCVAGGHLTAMVLDAKGKTKFVSVPCRKH